MLSPRTRPATIDELCQHAESWASTYYRGRTGRPTREHHNIRDALRPLRELAGYAPLDDLRAELLYDARQWMIDEGLSRGTINKRLERIKRIIRWAAKPPRRWIDAASLDDLQLVDPLKRHRTDAPEGPGVAPVPWELVEQTIQRSPVWLAVALRLHWWSGARPVEIITMRRSELAERDGVMIYSPQDHKTAHFGQTKHIVFGPRGMEVLKAWLLCVLGDELFHVKTEQAYYQAIQRVCRANHIPQWSPNQIRHAHLTRIGQHDPEGARAVAGHATLKTTDIYIARDLAKAIEIQKQYG